MRVGLELGPPPDGAPFPGSRRSQKGASRVLRQVVRAPGPLDQDGFGCHGSAPEHVDDAAHGRGGSRRGLVEDAGEAVGDVLPRTLAAAVVAPEESAADGSGGGLGDGEDEAVSVLGGLSRPGEVRDGARGGDLREIGSGGGGGERKKERKKREEGRKVEERSGKVSGTKSKKEMREVFASLSPRFGSKPRRRQCAFGVDGDELICSLSCEG